jgi:hypothetical protein
MSGSSGALETWRTSLIITAARDSRPRAMNSSGQRTLPIVRMLAGVNREAAVIRLTYKD